MKKVIISSVFFLVLVSCTPSLNDKDLSKLNGYWEIVKVEMPGGETKDYKVNSTIDYFEIANKKGFRQKVMPQLNGTYLTNNLKENIQISNNDGDFYLNYSTNFAQWKEEIIELKDSVLVLKNKQNLEYHYKRQIPFSVK
jgi:hypothetical protein